MLKLGTCCLAVALVLVVSMQPLASLEPGPSADHEHVRLSPPTTDKDPSQTRTGLGRHHLVRVSQTVLGQSGASPRAFAVDDLTGGIYVATQSGWLETISGATWTITNSVYLGNNTYPDSVAFDSDDQRVFVGTNPGNLLVVSPGNGSIVANLTLGYQAIALTYDPTTDEVYAGMGIGSAFVHGGSGDYNITAVNGATYAVSEIPSYPRTDTIYPFQIASDNVTGQLIALGNAGVAPWNDVVAFDAQNGSVDWNVSGGPFLSGPLYTGVAVDSRNGEVFLSNCQNDTIAVLNGSTGILAASYPVPALNGACATNGILTFDWGADSLLLGNRGSTIQDLNLTSSILSNPVGVAGLPTAMTFDESAGHVLVLDIDTSTIAVLEANNSQVESIASVGGSPDSVALDSMTGNLYVTGVDNVSVVNGTNDELLKSVPVGLDPSAVLYDPSDAEVFVANTDSNNVSVISTMTNSVVGSISVDQSPWALAWDNATDTVFVACMNLTEPTGDGYIDAISASAMQVSLRVSTGADSYPDGLAYVYSTDELFVAHALASLSPNLTVLSAASGRYVGSVPLPIAAEPGVMEYDSETGYLYVSNAGYGNNGVNDPDDIIVNPQNLSTAGKFADGEYPIGLAIDPAAGLIFATSLLNDTVEVVSASTLNVTAVGTVPAGSFPWGAVWNPVTNRLAVVDWGSNELTFFEYEEMYPITIVESGLPSGTNWSVTLNGSTAVSTGDNVAFSEPNGTYPLTVPAIPGYTITPPVGNVSVSGTNVTVNLDFAPNPPETYSVVFAESGLSPETPWAVDFNDVTQHGNSTQITFGGVPNGTFSFIVPPISIYYVAPASGRIGIVGGNYTENVVFTALPPHVEAAATWTEVAATGLCGPPGVYSLTIRLYGNATGGSPPYTYSWNFGDGSPPSTLQDPEHTYVSFPNVATLTVTDHQGNQSQESVTIPGVVATCPTPAPISLLPSLIVLALGTILGIVVGLVAYGRKK
jgi:YVTN family beta-propeller protein